MEIVFLVILFALMAAALGSGFPVAFALPGAAIAAIGLAAGAGILFAGDSSAYFHSGGPLQWLTAGVTNFRSVYWEAERDTLIAIPLFIFMGIMLQRSKIAEDLLVTMAQLFGSLPGGLGISVVFVGALLAATTGIVGATVVAMGLISLPAMMRHNYSHALATGTIAASGTLGQIIPPSIVLIILADQLASAADQAGAIRTSEYKATTGELSLPSEFAVESTSAGEMFLGALIPGLVLVGLYMVYILIFATLRPSKAPAVPYEGKRDLRFWGNVFVTLFPPLALIILVLGSIIAGIATVNQAGAIGAAGALVMAGYRLRAGHADAMLPSLIGLVSLIALFVVMSLFTINVRVINTENDMLGMMLAVAAVTGLLISIAWSTGRTLRIEETMQGVMLETAKTTALVFIILLGAAMLTAAFRAFGGEDHVKSFLNALPGGFWTQFIIVMAVIFILGFFLDFIEIAVVVVPIVAPILLADPGANVTAVWLGVMIGLNIQTSFLTPPFGFALFYLRGVAPAAVKTIQMYAGVVPFILLQLGALAVVGAAPWLVNYMPNVVKYSAETAPPPSNPRLQLCLEEYVADHLAAQRGDVEAAIARAKALDLSTLPKTVAADLTKGFAGATESLAKFDAAQAAAAELAAATPAYADLHHMARAIERRIRRAEDRLEGASPARAAELEAEIAALKAQLPADWKERNAAFGKLAKAETRARQLYRRTADNAYEPVAETRLLIAQGAALADFSDDLDTLDGVLAATRGKDAAEAADIDRVKDVRASLRSFEGVGDITTALNEMRKALEPRGFNLDEAAAQLAAAKAALAAEVAWRAAADTALSADLEAFDAALRDTIGARSQARLSEEQADHIARCTSNHRDLSLFF